MKIEGGRRLVAGRTPGPQPIAGPFDSVARAKRLIDAIRDAIAVHRCTEPRHHPQGCAFGEMGRCVAPCISGEDEHAALLSWLSEQMATGSPEGMLSTLRDRMDALAGSLRFEEAAAVRDSIEWISRAALTSRMIRWFRRHQDLVIARHEGPLVLVRSGLFVRSSTEPLAADPQTMFLDAPPPPPGPLNLEVVEEMRLVYRHLLRGWRILHPVGLTIEDLRREVQDGQTELESSIRP